MEESFMILSPGDIGNAWGGWEVVSTSDWTEWFEGSGNGPLECDRNGHETQKEAEDDVRDLIARGLTALPEDFS